MSRKSKKNKNSQNNSTLKKVVVVLAILAVLIPLSSFGYFYFKLHSMVDDSVVDNNILDETDFKAKEGITNILLVGTDARPDEDVSRSDAMMILTVDNISKKLKITSLNRDTYVKIPGHSKEKLTHAYVYGGINLLTETIENNFELDIQNYAIVNFLSFMDIIDALGGVEVNVKESEIDETNKFIKKETYPWSNSKEPMELIEEPGVQVLNGYQALSFARIRKNDSTMERDRRQSEVIEGIIKGVQDLPVSKYPKLLNSVLPYVKTNMTPTDIISTGITCLNLIGEGINRLEFPIEENGMSEAVTLPGAGFVIKYDEESLEDLHNFIFEGHEEDNSSNIDDLSNSEE